ncbi:MAG: SPOR domain-containing protein [Myxococcota bacterium]
MSELARRRNARDLWISRGHLAALAVGAVALSATTFAIGFAIGRNQRPSDAVVSGPFVPDDQLVELLARVDANAAPDGATEELTFQDTLRGSTLELPAVPVAPEPTGRTLTTGPGVHLGGDPPPAGAFTVVVERSADGAAMRALQAKLAEAGVTAWVGAELVDGVPAFEVAVGGYPTAEAAAAVVPVVRAAGGAGTVEPIR